MKFREWLEREKIPVTHAARYLEVHENHLYLILNGKRFPGYHLAKAIEEYTNKEVTVDELVRKKDSLPKCPHCGRTMYGTPRKAKKDLGLKE